MALFNFALKPFQDCYYPNHTGKPTIGWFWFSYSYYWFAMGDKKVLQVTDEFYEKYCQKDSLPYFDYPMVTFFEDLLDCIALVLKPIPQDVFEYISTQEKLEKLESLTGLWLDKYEDTEPLAEQISDSATEFIWSRNLYLTTKNYNYFLLLRCENEINIYWDIGSLDDDKMAIWQNAKGSFFIPVQTFIQDIKTFLDEFFSAMDKQVEEIIAYYEKNQEQSDFMLYTGKISEGPKLLRKEHEERRKNFYERFIRALNDNVDEEGWLATKEAIEKILNSKLL